MRDLRPIFLIIGVLLTALGGMMLIPMIADLISIDAINHADWMAFAISSMFTCFIGISLIASNWGRIDMISVHQGFLITGSSWITLVLFAALPLWIGQLNMSFTDAFFETMSGLTTTGATVIVGLDDAPLGLLLWRSILQWIGGIGIIIMAIALMPMLGVGGMQLFRLQGADTNETVTPAASQMATGIFSLYIGLTVLCFLIYLAFGMSSFDAINHAMTTIATGGFSTKDASFGYFLISEDVKGPIDLACVAFMIVGSLPFALYLAMVRGERNALLEDSQTRFFLGAVLVFTLIITLRLLTLYEFDPFEAFRLSAFNVVSIMTGTGYASTDYALWGAFAYGFFFCIMFVGGCAGSTSCGLKVFRLQVAIEAIKIYARRLAFPNGVFVARYNGCALSDSVFISVLSFFFVYFVVFATTAVALSLFQLDPVTALSAAGSAVANVGPGLGEVVGPAGTYKSLPDGAKWVLCTAMLLGRLEFFALLVVLTPSFWRG